MNFWQTIRVAARALLRNKLRSVLTTLGVIIGVLAVVAMVTLGEGAKSAMQQTLSAMGSNMLVVMSGTTTSGGAQGGFGSMPTLSWDDLHAVQNEVPSVRTAAPVLRSTAQVISEDQNWTTSVYGTTPEYFDIRTWSVASGSLLTASDVESGAKVVVLGQTVVDKLYGASADPVGQMVRIRNVPFQIAGVLTRKGQSASGQDYDDGVYIPVSTYASKISGGLKAYIAGVILVSATGPDTTVRAEQQVSNLLRDRHHIQPGSDDDFSIRNLAEMANAQQESAATQSLLIVSIAAVSLLVGGIGIMNIMLVSVTERTREIGLRMAVGAKPRDVMVQFLIEALTLSTIGGLIGIAGGLGVALFVSWRSHWPMLIRVDIMVIAVAFSAFVGLLFGLYPAWKASRLDPIDALRYE
jgi:putative ABC transport system permease protein